MKKTINTFLLLFVLMFGANLLGNGFIKKFSEHKLAIGKDAAAVREFVFDYTEDANTSKITVDPADEKLNFVGVSQFDENINSTATLASNLLTASQVIVNSTTLASKPFPRMTNAQRDLLSASQGDCIYSTTDVITYCYDGVSWVELGAGGGGGLDVYHTENYEKTLLTDWTKGNDPTFYNGGALTGNLLTETSTPIASDTSFYYLNNGAAVNDWLASPVITLDDKQKDNDNGVTFYFTYNGADDDVEFVVWDVTNSVKLTSVLELVKNKGSPTRYATSFYPLSTTAQIVYGFHVKVQNTGKILKWDDTELSTNPFVYKDIIETQFYTISQASNAITSGVADLEFNLGTATIKNVGENVISVANSSGRTEFKANRKATVSFAGSFLIDTLSRQSKAVIIRTDGTTYVYGSDVTASGTGSITSGTIELGTGDYFYFETSVNNGIPSSGNFYTASGSPHSVTITAVATTEHVVTPASGNLTDWADYIPTYQGIGTPTNVQAKWRRVGDSVEIQARLTTGTVSASTLQIGLPNSYIVDSSYTRHYIEVGSAWFSGTSNGGSAVASGSDSFIEFTLDNTPAPIDGNLGLTNSSDLTFNAIVPIDGLSSDAVFLAAVPVQKVAYIDVHATDYRYFIGSTTGYKVVPMVGVSGDIEILSISANRLGLSAGKYLIEWGHGAYQGGYISPRLVQFPEGIDTDFLKAVYNVSGSTMMTHISHTIEISDTKEFELRTAATLAGGEEWVSRIKITKLR